MYMFVYGWDGKKSGKILFMEVKNAMINKFI